jgi:hypothetical protein
MTVKVSGPAGWVGVAADEQAAKNNRARSKIRFIGSFDLHTTVNDQE